MEKRVETVVFKGIKFRRYSDSEHLANRRYFVPGIADKQRGIRALHQEVWMDANGVDDIPPGFHVHHRDHDTSNNSPGNLELVEQSAHFRHHGDQPRSEDQVEHWERVRAAAAAWHGSEAGIAWHREHGKRTWEGREHRTEQCQQCGSDYDTRAAQRHDRFCSNACKSAWRRASGVDDVDRDCPQCGGSFRVNKYSKQRFCSRSCGSRSRRSAT
ncbi:HNH endonuclease signature motif containing protein [Rhodococcus zopfii]|uniref:HNH endonuclease signature motif containing protein n=1 Tax=Rhodococcus zopfii TaxID=43772 RepID=UPI0036547AE6